MSRTRRLTALCLTIAALAPAGAQAYPLVDGPPSDPPDPALAAGEIPTTRTIVVASGGGFDWADAAAGFAGAACLSLLAVGTVAGVRRRGAVAP